MASLSEEPRSRIWSSAIDASSADDGSEAEWNGNADEDDEEDDASGSEDDRSDEDSDTADMEVSGADDDDDDDFDSSASRRTRLSTKKKSGLASFFLPGGSADDAFAQDAKRRSAKARGAKRKDRSERAERIHNRRRKIADVRGDDDLDDSTRRAREAEQERATHTIDFAALDASGAVTIDDDGDDAPRVCLNVRTDGSPPTGEPGTADSPVLVHESISSKLKPHQIVGTQFLWSHIAVEPNGFGCVLADFMGLGKTLQVITVVEAFLSMTRRNRDDLLVPRHKHVLILAPTICVRNWEAEVVKWLGKKAARRLGLTTLESSREKKMADRIEVVKKWHRRGGLLIMGYELYRILVLQSNGDEKVAASNQKHARELRDLFKCLADPGPDLIVLDEGHRVRDHKSKLVKALGYVKTSRRIILTGYPLQNHLEEYWTMVNFARPDFLGSLEEFKNRFVDPIKNGQCIDSSEADLRLARQRAYVLTRELKPLVLRRDQQYLFKQLPPKKEWVLICKLSDAQAALYRKFLEHGVPKRSAAILPDGTRMGGKVDVLGGYHISMAIANHPDVLCESYEALEDAMRTNPKKFLSGKHKFSLHGDDMGDDDGGFSLFDDAPVAAAPAPPSGAAGTDESDVDTLLDALAAPPQSGAASKTAALGHRLKFAEDFVKTHEQSQVGASGKMIILMALLRECRAVGDRVILFSQSIPTLNTIEKLIAQANRATRRHRERLSHLRIDGSTPQHERFRMISQFNDLDDDVDLIMISTKAGGEGINLCAGNRIVIFDVCWNPCNDSQSMCRSYRFGQTKPVFVYRFVTTGTMEKKVYDLQIRKEGVAKRIVDEKTTERRFKNADLANYFNLDDFEASLKAQAAAASSRARSADAELLAPQDVGNDDVLARVLAQFQDLSLGPDAAAASPSEPSGATDAPPASPSSPSTSPAPSAGGWIVDWFEQETMFEEDLDQQCSPAEAKEIMESHMYTKSLRRLRKAGTHLIRRDGILYATCAHCRANNEVYPEATTGVPVPTNLECMYCKRAVPTAGATATPPAPVMPYGYRGHLPGALPGGVNLPGSSAPAVVADASGSSAMPLPGAAASGATVVVLPDGRVLPPHLASIYLEQQRNSREQQLAAIAAQRERQLAAQNAQRAFEREQAEKRRLERQTYELKDRCLLVLRRGMAGCQELKRAAEACGATIAIEVNSQTTDIVSAMSLEETLKFLRVPKLPKDVELRDDTWLRNEIAKARGLAPSSSSHAVATGAAAAASGDANRQVASSSAAATAHPTATRSPPEATREPMADTSSDMIELLDSDNEGDAAPPAAAATRTTLPQRTPNNGDDDDDDVIEIL